VSTVAERTLILLRHAKSDWAGTAPDFDRPLAERGLRQAPEVGQWLAKNIPAIDLAVVSPANRARTTWQLACEALDPAPPTEFEVGVYAASADDLLEIVRGLPDDALTVVMVGHNPGMQDLVALLTDEFVPMTTSALAVIGLDGGWSTAGESPATLQASGRPPTPH
jgi:phosphohistidine phosphatase